jgi:UDP-N-acetylmuramoyl-tripeptide--D-alanyl-D-alanine ligase
VPEHRFQVIEAGAWTVVDDAYNANPLSMRRSVENAAEMAGEGGLVLVLGDMLELGEGAARLHRELGERLAAARPRAVFWQGAHAADVAEGLGGAARLVPVAEPCDLSANLAEMGISGGVALIKGSRSCKMERYVRTFADDSGECAA